MSHLPPALQNQYLQSGSAILPGLVFHLSLPVNHRTPFSDPEVGSIYVYSLGAQIAVQRQGQIQPRLHMKADVSGKPPYAGIEVIAVPKIGHPPLGAGRHLLCSQRGHELPRNSIRMIGRLGGKIIQISAGRIICGHGHQIPAAPVHIGCQIKAEGRYSRLAVSGQRPVHI